MKESNKIYKPPKNACYSQFELKNLGFKYIGNDVFISKKASFYGIENISIDSNVRIDDFCILSGNIKIGSFIHIGAFCALYGGNNVSKNTGIVIEDFCTISPKATIFASSDDFSGEALISPMVSSDFSNVTNAKVLLKEHTQICSNAVILPGVICEVGSVVGAMSLLKSNTESFSIYAGIPAVKIKNRSKKLLVLKEQFLASLNFSISKNSSMGGGRRHLENLLKSYNNPSNLLDSSFHPFNLIYNLNSFALNSRVAV
ncbi:acyltransferase [Helicobacter sp. MIT 14-3879]|uniref:acyltransferase n=1 Tax=Helicobacter sp. MIT 14-3879 TaxID=2040649 RepID=UPI000E1EA78D|nr:acyltransferase [Helicobacter sp. MIT 14-3879]RDU64782.1 galactoside O-acetyltransferase [Helicobacter sp. MIT 14-3879]